ncbi:active regulator of SIRT1-like [Condylostylus longicornis]|uniref:active regulator of SIRT1-like n=1 Tax=Condylostylus longicornis TaxID=2530218 RepID=UPI00244DDE57|nr:active regulator of SIRT1-like [Condylostylus longicornis]
MSATLLKKSIQIVEESQIENKKNKNDLISKNNVKGKHLKRLNDSEAELDKRKDIVKPKEKKKKVVLDKSTAEMLFEYARGESRKNLLEESKQKKKKEESIFTEEDFQKFEREYFG